MVDRAYALAVLLLICLIPAKATAEQPRNPVIVVPGILGSRLCDQNNTVLRGGTAKSLRVMKALEDNGRAGCARPAAFGPSGYVPVPPRSAEGLAF